MVYFVQELDAMGLPHSSEIKAKKFWFDLFENFWFTRLEKESDGILFIMKRSSNSIKAEMEEFNSDPGVHLS